MFTDSYRPYTSGVVRSLDTFTRQLEGMGHRVFIFAPAYGRHQGEAGVFRYFAVPAPTNRRFYVAIPLSWRTGRTVRSLQLDVIHAHSPFGLGRLGMRHARRQGIPVVFTYHTRYDQYAHYAPLVGVHLRSWVGRLARDFANRADAVIAPTGSIKELLQEEGVRSPLRVVPTGVDPGEFSHSDPGWARQTLHLEPGRPVIVSVGRLGAEKNLEFLIRVAGRLDDRVTLVMVGDGPLREQLETLVRQLGLAGRVKFSGQLDRPELGSVLKAACLMVFSSHTDTQGVVLLEALAAGLPVVAVDAPGARDMVTPGVNGFLTPPDEACFAQAVKTLLDDAQLHGEFSRAARRQAEGFSSRACAQLLVEVYREVAHQSRS
ncbi:MAG TPA: glycosyltransferase family 4 protein [Clostridiales bacterium UBA8153]|nr:glycosyltransferase family 4 protein [Clostridiales bacterium UBA8153]